MPLLHAPEEVLFQKGFMSSPCLHALVANFSSGTLQTGVPRERKDASVTSPEWLSCLRWAPHGLAVLSQFPGLCGHPIVSHMEAWPSPMLEALMRRMFCPSSAKGEVPLPPDGGQPTRATVLKLSIARLSKASNGHNNSYLQSTIAFTAWDPTGLYKRNKLIHTLTRRRLSPTPARQPPLG